jgi:hypothetical protein
VGVFGNDVEAFIEVCEPDLDFARQTALPPARSQVEVLLAVELICL